MQFYHPLEEVVSLLGVDSCPYLRVDFLDPKVRQFDEFDRAKGL